MLTQEEVASYLGRSKHWCEKARYQGYGPNYIKMGRHVRYLEEDVLSYLESCKVVHHVD
ncbi:helix-turn-helix domain-containing protein [uncultured Methylophaga sp.]|uniref:helix-turn-helix transcriptional regulator n=1 Tax=uncultured Methylophaga sp. TaxID=285271 RepID=UPI00344C3F7D